MAAFYEQIVRPAVSAAAPHSLSNWPSDYDAERFRATREETGQIVRTTRIIKKEAGFAFLEAIFQRFRGDHPGLEFARGGFLAIEVRGVKDATRHDVPTSPRDTRPHRAWHEAFNFVNLSRINTGFIEAFVDVAITVTLPGYCLAWKKSSHPALIAKASGYSEQAARAVMRDRAHHHTDLTNLMLEIAGFRSVFAAAEEEDEPQNGLMKLNVYTTDKAHTALTDHGRFAKYLSYDKALTPSSDADNPGAKVKQWLKNMTHVYETAVEKRIDGGARFEARMKYNNAMYGLIPLATIEFLKDHLIAVRTTPWWYVAHRFCGPHTADHSF